MTAPSCAGLQDRVAAALAAIGGFEAGPVVAVAVSGGPDSMALVLLADGWARQRGGRAYALTVDHGLRPESAAEAATVAGWLAARGIPHETLVWSGAKPTTGIQAAARTARYDLLVEWCRRNGVLHLLTAHHREDQAETYLIRRRAKSGIDGLAGISAVRELAGCRLVRPLLAAPRAQLAALLEAERQPFLRDPSNLNPIFERARLRSVLDDAAVDAAVAETRASAGRRIERAAALDALIARAVAIHPAGFAAVEAGVVGAADAGIAERLLGRVVACIGAAPYPARRVRLARLRAALAAVPNQARTLGGCRLVPWRGWLLVLREPAAAAEPIDVEPGCKLLWDRRFAVELSPDAPCAFRLGYLGRSGGSLPARRFVDLPPLVDPVLPALWDAAGLAAVPHLGYRRADIAVLPRLSFRSAMLLTRAGFTVV